MAITGKTGADAIKAAFHIICRVLLKYETKLRAAIEAARIAGLISSSDEGLAYAFIDGAKVLCIIFEKVADYSNVF